MMKIALFLPSINQQHISLIGISVFFSEQMYFVDEDAGPIDPVLVLSNPTSTDVTVEVFNTDGSATGEQLCTMIILHVFQALYLQNLTGGGVDYDS